MSPRFLIPFLLGSAVALVADVAKLDGDVDGDVDVIFKDTIPGYMSKYGIDVEEHWATTEDGYILKLFRLPRPGAPVVLGQHGILCSSWFMLVNDPALSPGLQLYNEGYDVWLTNSRGNTFSTNHTTFKPFFNKKFWNFSWSDMGRFDVPANIEYILGQTGKKDLTFVGWSQGTSQFFVAMVDDKVKSLVDEKVNLFVALAPVTFMEHQKAKLFDFLVNHDLDTKWEDTFPFGFLTTNNAPQVADMFCIISAGLICDIVIDVVAGNGPLDSSKAVTNFTAHFPAGVSMKSIEHYAQSIRAGTFREYDYGPQGNLQQYNQEIPPNFDLSKMAVPTALFSGGQDTMGDPEDVATLKQHIPEEILVFDKTYEKFSHMTFFLGTEGAFQSWYPDMQALLHKYNPLPGNIAV